MSPPYTYPEKLCGSILAKNRATDAVEATTLTTDTPIASRPFSTANHSPKYVPLVRRLFFLFRLSQQAGRPFSTAANQLVVTLLLQAGRSALQPITSQLVGVSVPAPR